VFHLFRHVREADFDLVEPGFRFLNMNSDMASFFARTFHTNPHCQREYCHSVNSVLFTHIPSLSTPDGARTTH